MTVVLLHSGNMLGCGGETGSGPRTLGNIICVKNTQKTRERKGVQTMKRLAFVLVLFGLVCTGN